MHFSAQQFYLHRCDSILRAYAQQLPKLYRYHNIRHIADVIHASHEIAVGEQLDEESIWTVKVAALYHDIGLIHGVNGHESLSVVMFEVDIKSWSPPAEFVKVVSGCIMATRLPQQPTNALEKVLCDADLDYLGRPDFFEKSALLFEEKNMLEGISKKEWETIEIGFLQQHHYHTAYNEKRRQAAVKAHLAQLLTH